MYVSWVMLCLCYAPSLDRPLQPPHHILVNRHEQKLTPSHTHLTYMSSDPLVGGGLFVLS